MKSRVWTLHQRGVALLELASILVALLPVFLAALIVIQSLGLSLRSSELLEYAIRSDETIPLRIRGGESGFVDIEIDRDGIDRSIGSLTGLIEASLRAGSPDIDSDRYRIEVTVGLVEIEPTSGRANLSHIEIRNRIAGGATVSSRELESTDPRATIAAAAGVSTPEGKLSRAARVLPGRESGYLPIAPFLHVRIFQSAYPDSVRILREMIGLKPYVSVANVALLRTEVSV